MGQADRLKTLITAANQRLASANIRVVIQERGAHRRLCLRATFPPKPGEEERGWHQQRLNLEVDASPEAIARAEDQAKIIGGQLNMKQFAWTDWIDCPVLGNSCWERVMELETHYWRSDPDRTNPKKIETWRVAYASVMKSLPMETELTPKLLERWIEENSPATRRREHYVTCANRLCEMAGIKHDFSWLLSGIGTAPINPRRLPSEKRLIEMFESVRGGQHGWIVGMMIAYGLRNHELFDLDLTDFPEITTAATTKTGSRIAIPFLPEGISPEAWGLDQRQWPDKGPLYDPSYSNSRMGRYICGVFTRKFDDVTAYDCRHCFARRLKDNNLDAWDAAKLMGHSERTHVKRYQAWFGGRYHIDRIKKKVGRD
jgi:integrase